MVKIDQYIYIEREIQYEVDPSGYCQVSFFEHAIVFDGQMVGFWTRSTTWIFPSHGQPWHPAEALPWMENHAIFELLNHREP